MSLDPVVIVGAGPAGLTAAHELLNVGCTPLVFEQGHIVGGIARTHEHNGYRFDLGGHRFFTRSHDIDRLWQQMLGDDLLTVDRLSRIFYQGKFINYPLEVFNALASLGLADSLRIIGSYARVRLRPLPNEDTLEQWMTNRFGRRLYETFFKSYTEKVWGIPCNRIEAEWAAQRIEGLSLIKAVIGALLRSDNGSKSLIKSFRYPRLGPGMMWQRFAETVSARGGVVRTNTAVTRLTTRDSRVIAISTESPTGPESHPTTGNVISTMPITELVQKMDPTPPDPVLHAANALRYRAFILVGLILGRPDLFADNWIYVHNPSVRVGRVQNFRNWSQDMVPDPGKTSLGMEYFCNEGDDLWTMSDEQLIRLASREIVEMGLADTGDVQGGLVIRQPKAYPVYDRDYRTNLTLLRNYLATIDNLQTIGRNGQHRYNNQDHSMLAAMLAVENLQGESHDVWQVNTAQSHCEASTRTPLQESVS